VSSGDDDNVHGRQRMDVPEGHEIIIAEDNVRGYRSRSDLAKYAVHI
jgi:hypothetical protein